MAATLSKSEFKLASDCLTRLKYKKAGYPKASDTDEFMEMLAEGGYMIGKLATLLYPDGIDINTDATFHRDKYINTAEWMKKENVVLYEGAFKTPDGRNIRADIIEKSGSTINLIEVKAKSWDSDNYIFERKPKGSNKKNILGDFTPYLEDVCFQYSVLKDIYPDHNIEPFLLLPDKAKTTQLDSLNGSFAIEKLETSATGFKSYDVEFTGDLAALRADKIMTLVDVSEFVGKNLDIIRNRAGAMLAYMNSDFRVDLADRILGPVCKSCDFRLSKDESPQNGYKDCWGEHAYHPDHFFGLYQFGNLFKGDTGRAELQRLIEEQKFTIADVPDDRFVTKDGRHSYNGRPWMQKTGVGEQCANELKDALRHLKYPLCFIDFECSRMALPYHKHMRPYELVAYQWSTHTIAKPGDEPVHAEWINTKDSFPNFDFVRALYEQIKEAGTILIWSHYERTVLKEILRQYEFYHDNNLITGERLTEPVLEWLRKWLASDKDDHSWIFDMEKMCKQYYFHRDTKGRSSIKPMLPAVLNAGKDKKIKSWLQNFEPGLDLYHSADGIVQDPYYALPKIEFDDWKPDAEEEGEEQLGGDETDYVVKNGGAAMRAYQDMMYGFAKGNAEQREKIKVGLLQYCKLDTLAMVIIWKYWMSKL